MTWEWHAAGYETYTSPTCFPALRLEVLPIISDGVARYVVQQDVDDGLVTGHTLILTHDDCGRLWPLLRDAWLQTDVMVQALAAVTEPAAVQDSGQDGRAIPGGLLAAAQAENTWDPRFWARAPSGYRDTPFLHADLFTQVPGPPFAGELRWTVSGAAFAWDNVTGLWRRAVPHDVILTPPADAATGADNGA